VLIWFSFKLIIHLSIDLLYRIIYIFVNVRKIQGIMFTVMSGAQDKPIVYVIQEIAGTRDGRPKINIMGAAEFGTFKFLLPELSQIIFSPGPLIFKLR